MAKKLDFGQMIADAGSNIGGGLLMTALPAKILEKSKMKPTLVYAGGLFLSMLGRHYLKEDWMKEAAAGGITMTGSKLIGSLLPDDTAKKFGLGEIIPVNGSGDPIVENYLDAVIEDVINENVSEDHQELNEVINESVNDNSGSYMNAELEN